MTPGDCTVSEILSLTLRVTRCVSRGAGGVFRQRRGCRGQRGQRAGREPLRRGGARACWGQLCGGGLTAFLARSTPSREADGGRSCRRGWSGKSLHFSRHFWHARSHAAFLKANRHKLMK